MSDVLPKPAERIMRNALGAYCDEDVAVVEKVAVAVLRQAGAELADVCAYDSGYLYRWADAIEEGLR